MKQLKTVTWVISSCQKHIIWLEVLDPNNWNHNIMILGVILPSITSQLGMLFLFNYFHWISIFCSFNVFFQLMLRLFIEVHSKCLSFV